jgi:hypothetical protein
MAKGMLALLAGKPASGDNNGDETGQGGPVPGDDTPAPDLVAAVGDFRTALDEGDDEAAARALKTAIDCCNGM